MPVGDPLQTLARFYNLQTVYRDGFAQLRAAPVEAVLAVLKSLDAPISSYDDVADALRQRRQELWQRPVEPVLIAWEGAPLHFKLRMPVHLERLKENIKSLLKPVRPLKVSVATVSAFTRVRSKEFNMSRGLSRFHRFLWDIIASSFDSATRLWNPS